jgi:hypothetical protein
VEGVRTEEGLGSRVIKDLSRHLVGKNHVIYMDNFFSNPALFESLLAKGIYCSGTVRINRRGMPEAIKGVKLKERGDTLTVQKGNLVATAWKDKKVVTYPYSFHFTSINLEFVAITILWGGSFPNLYSKFSWLCWKVLLER